MSSAPIARARAWKGPLLATGVVAASLASAALCLGLGAEVLKQGNEAGERWRDLRMLHAEADRADSLTAAYILLDSALGKLGRGLDAGSEGGQALEILVREAKACSLGITQLQALEERDHGEYRELPFVFKATGGHIRFRRYLEALDALPWAMRMHAWTLKTRALHKADLEISLEFSVHVAPAATRTP